MKRLLNTILFFVFIFLPFTSRAQGADDLCKGIYTNVKAYLRGAEGRDSLTIEDVLAAGKLEAAVKGWQVIGFRWTESGTCLGGSGARMFGVYSVHFQKII